MNKTPNPTPTAQAAGSEFRVGQAVRMCRTVGNAPSGDSPGGIYGYAGETVIVRHIGGGTFPISVSHPGTKDGSTFGVRAAEIEAVIHAPNAKLRDAGESGVE